MTLAAEGEMRSFMLRVSTGARGAAIFAGTYASYVLLTSLLHGYLRAAALQSAARGPEITTYSMGPIERMLFGGAPSVWLQDNLPFATAWSVASLVLWASLFYLPLMLGFYVLAVRGPRDLLGILTLHVLLLLVADVIYSFFPTRPPWMDEPVRRIIADISGNLTSIDKNPLASSPSLHVGVPAAYALWFLRHDLPRFRRIGAALGVWTAAMAFAVVYTGEHYVLGALTGVALAGGAFLACRALGLLYAGSVPLIARWGRRDRRRELPAPAYPDDVAESVAA